MASFHKLQPNRYPSIANRETPEARYWKKFRQPFYQRLPGYPSSPVTDVSFCAQSPYNFSATSSTRVHVFSCRLNREATRLSRFGGPVFSGRLRPSDGALLAAGTGNATGGRKALVRVFQMQLDRLGHISGGNKPLLREFEGHKGDITVVRWSKSGLVLLSGSDDCTARLWNLSQGTESMTTLSAHDDYVRCAEQWTGVGGEGGSNTWVTGCYDHQVRLWDARVGTKQKAVTLQMDHGAPVSDLLPLPGGALMVTTGSNYCRIWDVMGGGKMLCEWSTHQKDITSVCLDGTGTRILTSAMDGHVKIHDATGAMRTIENYSSFSPSPSASASASSSSPSSSTTTSSTDLSNSNNDVADVQAYGLVHGMKFEKPVYSMALAPDNSRMVVGLSDGTLVVRKRAIDLSQSIGSAGSVSKKRPRASVYDNPTEAMRAQIAARKAAMEATSQTVKSGGTFQFYSRGKNSKANINDYIVTSQKKVKLQNYDLLMKEFSYGDALDSALNTRQPGVITALLEEMVARGDDALKAALGGRNDIRLEPLMVFLIKYVTMPKYSKLLVRICKSMHGLP
jgi:U3 small nucleolar RNA-associated protein 15